MHRKPKLDTLNIMSDVLYPKVIPLTLANFFHFLVKNEYGKIDITLHHYILNLFTNFSIYQKKLVEARLNSTSYLSQEVIFKQLENINYLLTNEIRISIFIATIDILNNENENENENILTLLKEALKFNSCCTS